MVHPAAAVDRPAVRIGTGFPDGIEFRESLGHPCWWPRPPCQVRVTSWRLAFIWPQNLAAFCMRAVAKLMLRRDRSGRGKDHRRLTAELAAQTTIALVAGRYIDKMEPKGRSHTTVKKTCRSGSSVASITSSGVRYSSNGDRLHAGRTLKFRTTGQSRNIAPSGMESPLRPAYEIICRYFRRSIEVNHNISLSEIKRSHTGIVCDALILRTSTDQKFIVSDQLLLPAIRKYARKIREL